MSTQKTFLYSLMDFRDRDRGRIETSAPLATDSVRIDGREYKVGPITGGSELPEDDDAPSEESVRFHEDQIERFEKNIASYQALIVGSRDKIDEHQQWLAEHSQTQLHSMLCELDGVDLQVILSALREHLFKYSGAKTYRGMVEKAHAKIERSQTDLSERLDAVYDGPSYPEMMKYPGKITLGDYSGLK